MMNKRETLLELLVGENRLYEALDIPEDENGQKALIRALMNVRSAEKASDELLSAQDAYLKEELAENGVMPFEEIPEINGVGLWMGDISRVQADAVVNSANPSLTGCFRPAHRCVDNLIHSRAGIQLRLECAEIIEKQGHDEPEGRARLTSAYNLPAKFILHTVPPQVRGRLTEEHEKTLEACYTSCLTLALENGIKTVVFSDIAEQQLLFPRARAAAIAVKAVKDFLTAHEGVKAAFVTEDAEIFKLYKEQLA